MPRSAPQAGLPQTALSRGQLLPHWLQRQWRLFLRSLSVIFPSRRFVADDETLKTLIENGQVATQYVDLNGTPSDDIRYNVNGSVCAIEASHAASTSRA